MSPLVSRPPYGAPMAVAQLPSGSPGGRGLPLDDSIPGAATFAKPEDDTGTDQTQQERKDESIYRVESPRDMGKKDGPERDEIDHSRAKPTFNEGKPDADSTTKTKYPYRDGIPNAHNAAFVAGLFGLDTAPELTLHPTSKVAANLDLILQGLNPEVSSRGKSCSVTLKRADIPNLRWIFSVDCGNGIRVVRLGATRKGNVVAFNRLDLVTACSCPAWRWSGAEYHSTTKQYQDPTTALQGTASTPNVRDPERINKVCKHVAAVLGFTQRWVLPNRR